MHGVVGRLSQQRRQTLLGSVLGEGECRHVVAGYLWRC